MNAFSATIIAVAIIAGGLLVGGRYESHWNGAIVVTVDRITGTVRVCRTVCEVVPQR